MKNPGSNIPQNSSCTTTHYPSQKQSKLEEQDMWDTWVSKDGLISDVFLWTLSYRRTSVGRPARTYKYLQQLCTDTGCSQEDLLEAMDNRDELWEREREFGKSVLAARQDDDDVDKLKKKIIVISSQCDWRFKISLELDSGWMVLDRWPSDPICLGVRVKLWLFSRETPERVDIISTSGLMAGSRLGESL